MWAGSASSSSPTRGGSGGHTTSNDNKLCTSHILRYQPAAVVLLLLLLMPPPLVISERRMLQNCLEALRTREREKPRWASHHLHPRGLQRDQTHNTSEWQGKTSEGKNEANNVMGFTLILLIWFHQSWFDSSPLHISRARTLVLVAGVAQLCAWESSMFCRLYFFLFVVFWRFRFVSFRTGFLASRRASLSIRTSGSQGFAQFFAFCLFHCAIAGMIVKCSLLHGENFLKKWPCHEKIV